jgi:hypothetical protein
MLPCTVLLPLAASCSGRAGIRLTRTRRVRTRAARRQSSPSPKLCLHHSFPQPARSQRRQYNSVATLICVATITAAIAGVALCCCVEGTCRARSLVESHAPVTITSSTTAAATAAPVTVSATVTTVIKSTANVGVLVHGVAITATPIAQNLLWLSLALLRLQCALCSRTRSLLCTTWLVWRGLHAVGRSYSSQLNHNGPTP